MAQKRSRAAFEADLQAQQSPYVFFGTPLPPLDSHTRDDGSYVPVWKQEVTDERGRKRLHGAFTGGFSAGYFNSVGSKEGWTPQTFVSSRSNRAKIVQNTEDYMDEEDLADAEDAKVLEAKDGFSGFGSTEDEVGGRGPFMDLFRTQEETMGVKLLKKMGWMEGQPIGPGRRKAKGGQPAGPGSGNGTTQIAAKLIAFVRKLDTKGLDLSVNDGASGQTRPTAVKAPSKVVKQKPKRSGFGVGVLNDTGSDEEDPYDVGPKLSYGKVAKEKKNKKKSENGVSAPSSNPLLPDRPVFVKKTTPSSGFRPCHDGKLPVDGFVLSANGPFVQDKKYSPPAVPEGWKPERQASSNPTVPAAYQSTADIAKASALNPSSRAAMLGESLLPGQSVFDFLSPAARDKLAAASKNPDLPAGRYQPPLRPPTPPSEESVIPQLDPQTAASALSRTKSGFVPYSDNADKLGRYCAFLEYRSSNDPTSQIPPPTCPSGMHRDDFLAELQEFANAAAIFKPMSGAMATRFTSSASVSGHQSSSKDANGDDAPLLRPGGKQLAPEEEAAKMGMYGPLTRKKHTFYPTRLLCKRFGVRPPVHVQPEPENGAVATSSGATPGANKSQAANVLVGFADRFTSGGVQSSEKEADARKERLEILGKKDMEEMRRAAGLPALGEVVKRKEREVEVDPSRNEALEAERPSEETFKGIFGTDD